jgi:hypothetical protein
MTLRLIDSIRLQPDNASLKLQLNSLSLGCRLVITVSK